MISFVMAVYNNEKYFPIAVKSILDQSFTDFELIVVDDGSTDNTPNIADVFARKDSRVRVIHQDNQWIYASFNNGIKLARGEYIYIVNSDDIIEKNTLQILMNAIEKYNHPDVIFTRVEDIYCDLNQKKYKSEIISPILKEDFYCSRISDNPETIMRLIKESYLRDQANLYKRDFMIQTPFRNDFYAADGFFNYMIMMNIESFAIVKDNIYIHYVYNDLNMNIANKKYYGYEHYMYNELYKAADALIKKRGIDTEENSSYFKRKRSRQFSTEIRVLLNDIHYKNLKERLNEILLIPYDDIIEASFEGGHEEFDSRIMSELRIFFIENVYNDECKNHYLFKFIESLLRYEKDYDDWENIRNGVYNELNPNHIGEIFYKKLINSQ